MIRTSVLCSVPPGADPDGSGQPVGGLVASISCIECAGVGLVSPSDVVCTAASAMSLTSEGVK